MSPETILLLLCLAPALGAIVCIPLSEKLSQITALTFSVAGLILSCFLYHLFDPHSASLQMVFSLPWISRYGIQFSLGVDGLSLPLVLLTKLMVPISILCSLGEKRQPRFFMIVILLLDSAMVGTFLAIDIFLFYVFWELMLIPMILIIGIWGSTERVYAAMKFFLFTFAGSVLMLVALFWIFLAHHEQAGFYTGNISSLYQLKFSPSPIFFGLTSQQLIFIAFALAFAVKIPLFPFHTWLPDAHVQAPTGGSILLAAILLKMGTYGFLRLAIPICPDAFFLLGRPLGVLSIIGILYGAWMAWFQSDFKKLVAYSSVSHLGFVMLGIVAMNEQALMGAMLQMVNHGLSTGALFLLVGVLYERRHSRNLSDFGGLASQLPWYAFFLTFVACSSMGVPGLNGFVGEFLILLGTFKSNGPFALAAVLGVIFGAVYTLSMLRGVLFGRLESSENRILKDMGKRDWIAILPLCFAILWLGLYPKPFMKKFQLTVENYWSSLKGINSKLTMDYERAH